LQIRRLQSAATDLQIRRLPGRYKDSQIPSSPRRRVFASSTLHGTLLAYASAHGSRRQFPPDQTAGALSPLQ
jgi:hypothetical protein